MRELLLFSQSQTLINHWINNIEENYLIAMNDKDLYATFNGDKKQIVFYDLQSFSDLCSKIIIKASLYGAKVFALTGAPSFDEGYALLPLKIAGYGNSYMTAENLKVALEVISEGNIWLYPDFVQSLIVQAAQSKEMKLSQKVEPDLLTAKELEVSRLVAQGMTNKEVAIQLGITERTVKAHLTHIYEKLNISDRLSLALMFKE